MAKEPLIVSSYPPANKPGRASQLSTGKFTMFQHASLDYRGLPECQSVQAGLSRFGKLVGYLCYFGRHSIGTSDEHRRTSGLPGET
jgi:hypothetical protein